MSFETKSQEPSLREELEKIPYHKLRAEFKERGIESAWTAGTKKAELIERALERLGVVKQAVEKVKVELEFDSTEEVKELVQEEIKKIDQEAENIIKEEEKKEMSELEKRAERLRAKFTVDGKLDLPALEAKYKGTMRGLNKTYDTKKKKWKTQSLHIVSGLIEEAKKQ